MEVVAALGVHIVKGKVILNYPIRTCMASLRKQQMSPRKEFLNDCYLKLSIRNIFG